MRKHFTNTATRRTSFWGSMRGLCCAMCCASVNGLLYDCKDLENAIKDSVRVQPFVIAHLSWLNANVALGTRRTRLICGFAVVSQIDLRFARSTRLSWVLLCISLGTFPCILMCNVVVFRAYLLVWSLETSECTRMLPRLVKSIYFVQENCVTDLGNYCPPLSRSRLESILRTCCARFYWAPFSVKSPRVALKGPRTRWRQKIPEKENYNHVTTTNKYRNINSQIIHG